MKTCSSCLPKSAGTGGPVHIVSSPGALESVAPCVLTVLFVAVVFRAFRRGRPFLRYRHSHLVCAGEIRCWCIAPPCVPTVGRWVGRPDGATRAESRARLDADMNDLCLPGPGGFGVFDGVGGWARHGVDPRVYAQVAMRLTFLVTHCSSCVPRELTRHPILPDADGGRQKGGRARECIGSGGLSQ